MRYLYTLLLLAVIVSCDLDSTLGSSQTDKCALQWAEAYFNYDFMRAAKLTTPESHKWLRFTASNITEEDLEVVRQQEQPATVRLLTVDDVNDSIWQALVEVSNLVMLDSIGHPATAYEEPKEFRVNVVCRNRRMFVKMDGVPQPQRMKR